MPRVVVSFNRPTTRNAWRTPAARRKSRTLSELAAIAIIEYVPHAFGSEQFHSVGFPQQSA